jgi:kynureninase
MGGMAALREKSVALTDLFIALVDERCAGHGLLVVSPREAARRGSQVCLTRVDPDDASRSGGYAIVQALIARGIVGDFRAGDGGRLPDILRFGFTPLYLRFVDVWDAVEQLRQVLESGEWRREEFSRSRAVT